MRGFTHRSEARSPEDVVGLLAQYYMLAENTLAGHHAIWYKYSADEVMAVFASAEQALAAARQLPNKTATLLAEHGLGAGIGIHIGVLVEGLLGSTGVRFYDVIGDTVNTARRLESAAGGGEILISNGMLRAAEVQAPTAGVREIVVKGKSAPLQVYLLELEPTALRPAVMG